MRRAVLLLFGALALAFLLSIAACGRKDQPQRTLRPGDRVPGFVPMPTPTAAPLRPGQPTPRPRLPE